MTLFYFAVGLLLVIPIYAAGLIVSIFYYKMAKNAGCRSAWIAFLPFGKNYFAFALPHSVYNIGIIKTKHRKCIFWLSSIAELLVSLIMGFGWAIIYAYTQCLNGYDQFAVWGALLNVISPLIMLIMPMLMVNRAPDYGLKNYYLKKVNGEGSI